MNLAKYRGKNVVVTGASGYIASKVISLLIENGAHVFGVTRNTAYTKDFGKNYKKIICDYEDIKIWQKLIEQSEIVIHLAGNTSLNYAKNNPSESLKSTLLPIQNIILNASNSNNRIKLIYASTATVYGAVHSLPVDEKYEVRPSTIYDLHKYCGEIQLQYANRLGLIKGVSLRLSNVYGDSLSESFASDRGILNKISSLALQGLPVNIYGSGQYLRDYVHVSDVAMAFCIAGLHDFLDEFIFNIGSGEGATIYEAFSKIIESAHKITNKKSNLYNVDWPIETDRIELRNYVANINLFKSKTSWYPKIKFEDGIDSMVRNLHKKIIK
jgi:nucleoside-diphosphate-sugar epimerase